MTIEIVGLKSDPNQVGSEVSPIADAVASSLAKFGFHAGELRLISHHINTVFRLTTETNRYAVRVHRSTNRTTNEISAELAWLDTLMEAEDISVPRVHRTMDDEAIAMVALCGSWRELPMTILDWVQGESLADAKGVRHFEELGRMTAALHRHAQSWSPSVLFDRPIYNSENVFQVEIRARVEEMVGSRDAQTIIAALSTLRQRLESVESELGVESEVFGLIHGDLSFGNVLFGDAGPVPIDFDDCGYGYYLHDLAVPLAGAWQKPGFERRFEAFIAGYRQILDLSGEMLRNLPVFLGLRSAQLIMDYVGQVPWRQGILDQYGTRLVPALEACDASSDWIR